MIKVEESKQNKIEQILRLLLNASEEDVTEILVFVKTYLS